MDKFLVYVSEYGGFPKPGVISSKPSVGGEFVNMNGLPSSRQYLIETKEGDLMGICSKTNKLCTFDIIDDTYVVQIPSIMKLKEALSFPKRSRRNVTSRLDQPKVLRISQWTRD